MQKDLLILLENHDFQELLPEDQSWVLTQMSQEEYTMMRMTLIRSQQTLQLPENTIEPIPAIHIWDKVPPIPQSARGLRRLEGVFTYQVPAWKAIAASLFLAVSLTAAWGNFKSSPHAGKAGYGINPQDTLVGLSLEEDSIFRKFLIESL